LTSALKRCILAETILQNRFCQLLKVSTVSRPILRDVALRAGVSISVASNALNGRGRVNAETRRRVKEAAQDIGYVPSYSARRLRGENGRSIGAVIAAPQEQVTSERYFSESAYAFARSAAEAGFKFHHIHLLENEFSESQLYIALSDDAVDGVIIVAPPLPQIDAILRAMGRLSHIPYILFSASPDIPGASYVDSDGKAGASMAVQHLLSLGHSRIAYLAPPENNSNSRDRLYGCQAEMRRAGHPLFCYSLGEWTDPSPLDMMLADGITAVLAFDDLLALRIISDLERQGVHVPQDIAVIGFDDEAFGQVSYPRLTTIYQPLSDMGAEAVGYLVRRLNGETTGPYQKIFPVKLLVRESCGAQVLTTERSV
jgi:DNA-binding LacI/PurR family transcriptional regulator